MRRVVRHYFSVRRSIPILLSLPLGLLSAVLLKVATLLPGLYDGFLKEQTITARSALIAEGIHGLIVTVTVVLGLGSAVFLAGTILGFVRKQWALTVLRCCYVTAYVLACVALFVVVRVTGVVFDVEARKVDSGLDVVGVFQWRWELLWPVAAVAFVIGLVHLLSWRRTSLSIYTGYAEDTPAPGDLVIENIRTHGREPQFRKSLISSAFLHFAVIVLLPLLAVWFRGGCVEDYRVPFGQGEPVVSIVKMVQPKKKPKKQKIFNPKSDISFHIPDFDDDSDLQEQVEDQTQLTWVTDPASVHGKMGSGGGKTGGWPDGMKDGLVRFVRLEYDGEDWNDGMDIITRADLNFLEEFHKMTGFKVAHHSESHSIGMLANYTKGRAPPFVYMTGSNRINVSPRDLKVLREYLMEGGMLFADCGSAMWDSSFRAFMQVLFPGEPLLIISDDDPIYQAPFVFANGAPPLWHHGGSSALGIKRGGRWVVYYHPGDINDAWKTGHSGLRPQLAKQAYHLGINIVYHAFTKYLEATRKYRK